jgi:hypothetical protein
MYNHQTKPEPLFIPKRWTPRTGKPGKDSYQKNASSGSPVGTTAATQPAEPLGGSSMVLRGSLKPYGNVPKIKWYHIDIAKFPHKILNHIILCVCACVYVWMFVYVCVDVYIYQDLTPSPREINQAEGSMSDPTSTWKGPKTRRFDWLREDKLTRRCTSTCSPIPASA